MRLRCEEPEVLASDIMQQLSKHLLRQQVNRNKQKQKLLSVFRSVDVSHDGFIDAQELGALLETLGQDLTAAELRDRMREVDVDESGKLDFDEFAATLARWQEDELRDVFAFFDGDASGSISVAELSIAIQALGDDTLTPEEAAARASRVDSDGSGMIDCDEFCVYMSPMMAMTQVHHFNLERISDAANVKMTVNSLGVELLADVKPATPPLPEPATPEASPRAVDLRGLLASVPLLQHLSDKELKVVAGAVTARDYAAHELIVTQGESGVEMYFLNQGGAAAELFDIGVVKTYAPGEHFGEMALLRDQPRGASVRAGSQGATCWVLDRDAFNQYANTALLEQQSDSYTRVVSTQAICLCVICILQSLSF